MYYVYVLRAKTTKHIYIGYTAYLRKRLREHSEGKCYTTAKFLPVDLVYYEAYRSRKDAQNRERQLKQYGNALGHLKRRITYSLGESAPHFQSYLSRRCFEGREDEHGVEESAG